MRNEAIGAYEAAGLLGVHFTRPRKLAEDGVISSREIAGTAGRSFAVYSARECDENFREYERGRSSGKAGRPRVAVASRAETLRQLAAKSKPAIEFGDAIGVEEAARVLGVFWTLVPRMVGDGKIVGRILWSQRASRSRLWIFSRTSVEAWASEVRRQEESGTKKGRPRSSVDL